MTKEPCSDMLESLIDREGLYNILDLVSEICHLKADHLASNWQDYNAAKVWTRAGNLISKWIQSPTIKAL